MAPERIPEGAQWYDLAYREGGWDVRLGRRRVHRAASLNSAVGFLESNHPKVGALRRSTSSQGGACFRLWAKPCDSL